MPLQRTHALFALGSRTICWTPWRLLADEEFWETVIGSLEAKIK